jgi:hypothetical protein
MGPKIAGFFKVRNRSAQPPRQRNSSSALAGTYNPAWRQKAVSQSGRERRTCGSLERASILPARRPRVNVRKPRRVQDFAQLVTTINKPARNFRYKDSCGEQIFKGKLAVRRRRID